MNKEKQKKLYAKASRNIKNFITRVKDSNLVNKPIDKKGGEEIENILSCLNKISKETLKCQ